MSLPSYTHHNNHSNNPTSTSTSKRLFILTSLLCTILLLARSSQDQYNLAIPAVIKVPTTAEIAAIVSETTTSASIPVIALASASQKSANPPEGKTRVLILGLIASLPPSPSVLSTIASYCSSPSLSVTVSILYGTSTATTSSQERTVRRSLSPCATLHLFPESSLLPPSYVKKTRYTHLAFLRSVQRSLYKSDQEEYDVVTVVDYDVLMLPEATKFVKKVTAHSAAVVSSTETPYITCANGHELWFGIIPMYYDTFATISIDGTHLHPTHTLSPFGVIMLRQLWYYLGTRQGNKMREVGTCFGGMSIYPKDVYWKDGCDYIQGEEEGSFGDGGDGSEDICEHVTLLQCIRRGSSDSVDPIEKAVFGSVSGEFTGIVSPPLVRVYIDGEISVEREVGNVILKGWFFFVTAIIVLLMCQITIRHKAYAKMVTGRKGEERMR